MRGAATALQILLIAGRTAALRRRHTLPEQRTHRDARQLRDVWNFGVGGAGPGRSHRARGCDAFRTLIANRVAAMKMKTMTPPKTEKEFDGARTEVGIAAGIRLGHKVGTRKKSDKGKWKWVDGDKGNTALNSYINPAIFDRWKENIHE